GCRPPVERSAAARAAGRRSRGGDRGERRRRGRQLRGQRVLLLVPVGARRHPGARGVERRVHRAGGPRGDPGRRDLQRAPGPGATASLYLAPNVDVAASTSFVPGFAFNGDVGTFWHGTHVAGIVASSGLIGTAGIAPNATLIGVKVLHNGSGAFEWILNGILYAATPVAQGGGGAHIINMSLGATIDYRNNWTDKAFRDAFRELEKAYDRAVRYAYQDRKSTRLNSSHVKISYAVFCLKKKRRLVRLH